MSRTVIDLFSGCGGFGLGAELAGFESIVAIDIDPVLQSSYSKNFPRAAALNADVKQLDRSFWKSKVHGRPTAVIGGPPCQGFSRIGRRELTDPRNDLISHFFRQVKLLRPMFFVMENVEGLLDEQYTGVLERGLGELSDTYNVLAPMVINAADYGAPTVRRRVVIVGFDPAETDPVSANDFRPSKQANANVKDAIWDLPNPLEEGETWGWAKFSRRKSSAYAEACRALPPEHLGWEPAISQLRAGFVSGNIATMHTASVVRRFSKVAQGKTEPVSRFPRLAWERKCPTLRAGTGREKGSHQSMRPIHPDEARVITVREAARLQGFPDWFVFHPSKWHSFRMIGNSVSPIASKAIMQVMKSKCGD